MDDFLALADWRRRVAEMYAMWRHESDSNPEAATARLRQARDDLFRSHSQSPIPVNERARFGGLSYFDYDASYRMSAVVEGALAPADVPPRPPMLLPASGDEPFSFSLIGHVRLSGPLNGRVLPVFWMEGYAGGLFIPFRDATAGRETYGAGRYLYDSVKGADMGGDRAGGELTLDFNLAYHPSCAYDPRWNCPLAPTESRLDVPVRAGERLP